jgi:signal transduction histidine kinase
MANESRLAEMFLSLIGTAAHSVNNGANSGDVYITTRVDYSGDAVVEICDTGTGISVDTLDRMFTSLFTTKLTGLGLSSCRRIVAELGGELAVECLVGKGTTVTITLPKAVERRLLI